MNSENKKTLKEKLKYWNTHWRSHPGRRYTNLVNRQITIPDLYCDSDVFSNKIGSFNDSGCNEFSFYCLSNNRKERRVPRYGHLNFFMKDMSDGTYSCERLYGRGYSPSSYIEETERNYSAAVSDIRYSSKSLTSNRVSSGQLIKYINNKFSYFNGGWNESVLLSESLPPRVLTTVDRYQLYSSYVYDRSIRDHKDCSIFYEGRGRNNHTTIRCKFSRPFLDDLVEYDSRYSILRKDNKAS